MTPALLKSLLAAVPSLALLAATLLLFLRDKTVGSLLRFMGAVCLGVVVLTHILEALHLLPSMGWGREHSVGHYLDLAGAIGGLGMLATGYVLRHRWSRRLM